jgi:hypothetical protein
VRLAAYDVVDRPVPAVDRAVVQAQLGQLRDVAPVEHLDRVLLLADGQQRREVADVLLEQVEDRGDPALAEPHPRADALGLELLGPRVGRLLEERDPGLAPQLPTEEERRVGPERDLDPGDRLSGVPVRGEALRAHLKVVLHGGAGGLGRDRVGVRGQPLHTVDVQVQSPHHGRRRSAR